MQLKRHTLMCFRRRGVFALCGLALLLIVASAGFAQDGNVALESSGPNMNVLTAQQWGQVDAAVDRGLAFLARNQQRDGSFAAPTGGQPGITGLCVMAFLSRGHVPGDGQYGDNLERAIEFVLSTQQANGLLSIDPRGSGSSGRPNYNHAIAGVMLGEVYGMTTAALNDRIRESMSRALTFSRSIQTEPKRNPVDKGGWRYLRKVGPNDSDLTATSWQLMFYRSARNAELDVPEEYIDDAMGYVRRCYSAQEGGFVYALANTDEHYASGASVAGGIVALALGGEHQSDMVQAAGRWILRHPFTDYNRRQQRDDRYHYSACLCSQAMFQLGGEYWNRFYPELQRVLIANQNSDGSWDRESKFDGHFGNVYTTALSILALTPPYQLLPIYQR